MKNIFYLVGPTASGKSKLAAEVAARCGAEIVSADAFQIYRGLPILTAQPDESTLGKVPHHLVGICSLGETMSAEKFRALALPVIEQIVRQNKIALVVGGSGLYLKALTHGLAPLPAIDPALRAELNALSLDELHARLTAIDSLGAETIDRQNKRRLVRALEIFQLTKSPPSAQRAEWKSETLTPALGVLLFRERAELYERIDRRVEDMFRAGVVAEVQAAGEVSATADKALGFSEIRNLSEGKISEAECIAQLQQRTRRYAKRQLTWFRRQHNFEALNLSRLKDQTAAVDAILQKVALLRTSE